MAIFEARDVVEMVRHWLATPPNGFFGSGYGADLATLLLNPLSAPVADSFLNKLRQDIPLLAMAGDAVSVVSTSSGFERVQIFLKVGSVLLPLEAQNQPAAGGEVFRVDAQ